MTGRSRGLFLFAVVYFSEELIAKVQDANDIVDVISDYIAVKKSGANFKGLCPFHQEKTNTYTVSAQKQIFYCFGCHTGGNVFTFLSKYENMTFPEAVKTLAERAHIRLPEERRSLREEKILPLLEVNKTASGYFHNILISSRAGERALAYLRGRGITMELIKKFQLGFCPASTDGLLDELTKKGLSRKASEETGLSRLFRARITFPIFTPRGQIAGFGGRVLGEAMPKYINSPESPAYHKGSHLYGLNFTGEKIRREGKVIILEGYLDLLSAFQAGIVNSAASLGTALSTNQVNLLRHYAKEVVLVYDADAAGEKATLRALDLLVEAKFRVKIVRLPEGDPDEFIRRSGGDAFGKLIGKAEDLIDYKLNLLSSIHNPADTDGKVKIAGELLSTISKVDNAIRKRDYIKHLSERLSVDEDALLAELKKLKKKAGPGSGLRREIRNLIPFAAEKTLIRIILEDTKLIKYAKERISAGDFLCTDYQAIVNVLFGSEETDLQRIINRLRDENLSQTIAQIMVEPDSHPDHFKAVNDCIVKIKQKKVRSRRGEIQKEIARLESKGETAALKNLLLEYQQLIKNKYD